MEKWTLGLATLLLLSCGKDSNSSAASSLPAKPDEPKPPQNVISEPETGTSVRRVRWADVEVDALPAPMEELAKAGEGVFQQQCVVCHGAEGKGNGPAADLLQSRPRDFTRGTFKFRTSVPEETPFDSDLYRTITSGIPAAGMPSFADLTPFERWALVARVKKLAKTDGDDGPLYFFNEFPAKTKIKLPPPPEKDRINLARGAELFRGEAKCIQCHGESGIGDGPSAKDLKDTLGFPIKPADLTRGEVSFKAGSRPEDVFRVLTGGMPGTPMPSFTAFSDDDRWNLAFYAVSLYKPIGEGELTFLRVGCMSCHTVGKGKLIGPDLAGVTKRREREWLRKWLKDPPTMLATDETARKLMEEYLTPMPSYGLTQKEIEMLIKYLESLPGSK